MSDITRCVVPAGTLVTFEGIDLQVNANLKEPEFGSQPYVTINTEQLQDRFGYGKGGGMPIIAVHLNDGTIYDDEGQGSSYDVGTFGDHRLVPHDAMSGMLYAVGVTDTCERLAWFKSAEHAAAFIGTLPDHESGAYYLDGPEFESE